MTGLDFTRLDQAAFVSEVTQNGVTFTFSTTRPARQSVDGAWVVKGPVTITAITPAPAGSGSAFRNGLMVDPVRRYDPNDTGQAWDGRDGTFNAALERSSFPLVLQPNQVAVKCVSREVVANDRQGYPETTAALYVVDDISTLPSGQFFSPSPIGWTGRSGFDFWTCRTPSVISGLTTYAVSTHTSRASYAAIEEKVNRFQALAGYDQNTYSNGGYQAWLNHNSGKSTGTSNFNYAQWVMEQQEQAALAIIGDEITNEQKETLLNGLASMGVHLMQLGLGANGAGTTFYDSFSSGIGGQAMWAQFPLDAAILASADAPTINLYQLSASNMLLQAFEFDAGLIARLARHTSVSEPFDFRERAVLATDTVSTPNTIAVNMALGGENFRMATSSLKRVVSTDGLATTTMADPLNHEFLTTSSTLIPVLDASGFSGKAVYFEPVTPFQVGDFAWQESNYRTKFASFDIDLRGPYSRTNNRWGAWALFVLATGLGDAQRLPAIRWTESRAAGWRSQTPPFESPWSSQFWTQHAATIFTNTIGLGPY